MIFRRVLTLQQVLFLMREQKFLEQLESSLSSAALLTLRTQLTPLKHNVDRLHFLSSLIMVTSPDDLRLRASWSGAEGDSRACLLRQISSYISPNSMIPDARLMKLLDLARRTQVEDCLYHTSSRPTSYLVDHTCPRSEFPLHTSHILRDHTDEVWRVQYSPYGNYLATSGADGLTAVYDTRTMRLLHLLSCRTAEEARRDNKEGYPRGILHMTFNSEETMLMTCSQDNVIAHWDVLTGNLLNKISKAHNDETVTCASWLPGSNGGFVSGGHDKKIHLYDDKGGVIHTWNTYRVVDLKVSDNGLYLVAICTDQNILLFDMITKEQLKDHCADFELTSVTVSRDSSRLILSCSPVDDLYKLEPGGDSKMMEVQELTLPGLSLLRSYEGQTQGQFVVRSNYAGNAEQYIMSGSENSLVCVWHRKSGQLIECVPGHTATVNAVSWNPAVPQWASASDDKTVRIWDLERNLQAATEGPDAAPPSINHDPLASPSGAAL